MLAACKYKSNSLIILGKKIRWDLHRNGSSVNDVNIASAKTTNQSLKLNGKSINIIQSHE